MLADISQRLGLVIARLLTAAFALVAIGWAVVAVPTFSSQAAITDAATHILAGEVYNPETMEALIARINRDAKPVSRGSYLGRIAIVRLRNTENVIKAGGQNAIDENMTSLRRSVDAALANSPEDSFLWLVRFWAETRVGGVTLDHLRFLRMSYKSGSREGWIAAKRNGLALAIYPQLPMDLAEWAMSEFAGLVSSEFYDAAADVLAGPGWPIRKQLLARLTDLKERDRQQFARVLYNRDVEDVVVPGIEPPPRRPFRQ